MNKGSAKVQGSTVRTLRVAVVFRVSTLREGNPRENRCPASCFHFVQATAQKGEEPKGKITTCESCMVHFEPDTLFLGRWEGKKRLYNHVNHTDCKPKTREKGKCGECGTAASIRFDINSVDSDDSDKKVCEPCFVQGRTDKLMGCQPEAIKKREAKQAKFNGSNKKTKHWSMDVVPQRILLLV